ncbi:hypothetical protein CVT26_008990 [Gymnopilus dilepis]|uniref:Uncharacterized protein n=1 Tax=Gymnopilus dilepis TaxID=231916 RepID=A0A409WCZ2_9AGAR|nr:hypothetical protein CVT26_008990 [Gymnopilus dilepis]
MTSSSSPSLSPSLLSRTSVSTLQVPIVLTSATQPASKASPNHVSVKQAKQKRAEERNAAGKERWQGVTGGGWVDEAEMLNAEREKRCDIDEDGPSTTRWSSSRFEWD